MVQNAYSTTLRLSIITPFNVFVTRALRWVWPLSLLSLYTFAMNCISVWCCGSQREKCKALVGSTSHVELMHAAAVYTDLNWTDVFVETISVPAEPGGMTLYRAHTRPWVSSKRWSNGATR